MMERENLLELLEKIESGVASTEDLIRYHRLYSHFQKEGDWNDDVMGKKREIGEKMYAKINETITKPVRQTKFRSVFKYAAAIAVISVASILYFYYLKDSSVDKIDTEKLIASHDLTPGGNKATLTLGNGNQISLSDVANGDLIKKSGISITKTADGQVVYHVLPSMSDVKNLVPENNTITTPKGGEYQVVLPDGSKVWLNAASSLTFPTTFTGSNRRVELTGEGYFEIVENKKKPFIVSAMGTEVVVLGTHFNVMAYADEKSIATTLLEGSVQFKKGDSEVTLKPGQEGKISNSDKDFKIENIDVSTAVAWKNGLFRFDDESLESIMRKISRWYDVEIVYDYKNKDILFGGSVTRYASVSKVLDKLELTGGIHFKIEGRRITVTK